MLIVPAESRAASLCTLLFQTLTEADELPSQVLVQWHRDPCTKAHARVERRPATNAEDHQVTRLDVMWPNADESTDIALPLVRQRLALAGIDVDTDGAVTWRPGTRPTPLRPLPDALLDATQDHVDAAVAACAAAWPLGIRVLWRLRDPGWPPDHSHYSPYQLIDERCSGHSWRRLVVDPALGGCAVVHWPAAERWLGPDPDEQHVATWRAWMRECLCPALRQHGIAARLPLVYYAYAAFDRLTQE